MKTQEAEEPIDAAARRANSLGHRASYENEHMSSEMQMSTVTVLYVMLCCTRTHDDCTRTIRMQYTVLYI